MRKTATIISQFVAALATISLMVMPVFASAPRDFDSNAIIYGGAYSIGELQDKVKNGSGPNPAGGVYGNWQSPNGVRTFYNSIGIREDQWGVQKDGVQNLRDGSVNKDGTVVVDGVTVARGVFSSGRVNMGASTLRNYGPIPIYWREPKYSFVSDSLDAFVYLNNDGTFGYAIIKSCGNAVLDNNLYANVKPKTTLPEEVVPKNFKVTIIKFDDKNGNGVKEADEENLGNWSFKFSGGNINKTGITNSMGRIVFSDIPDGQYTISETPQSGWIEKPPILINVNGRDVEVLVGNQKKASLATLTPPAIVQTVPAGEVLGAETTKGVLPQAGAKEATVAFSLTSFATSMIYWFKSKKAILSALKK